MKEPVNYKRNINYASEHGCCILPNGDIFSMDGIKTRLNNNVIAMGTSGSSKTRSVVTPNLLSAVGSYIISDPKGNLYYKYGKYLKNKGYKLIHLDFIHPEKSDGYNPIAYVRTPNEIMKLAHYLIYAGKNVESTADPFWDLSAEILLTAIIGFIVDSDMPDNMKSFSEVAKLLTLIDAQALEDGKKCQLDYEFDKLNIKYRIKYNADPWSYQQFMKFRQTPPRTLNCILTTLQSNIGSLDTPEISSMMAKTTVDFTRLGIQKTAVFVEVSDTDRSKDVLINTFYTQAMNTLCTFADKNCVNSRLPFAVRFILDDFGTNCRIDGFENMISNIRSRNISAMIILQSESQLKQGYGHSAHTIMDNCDTFIYMGGNDVETAQTISKRANKPLSQILDMPVGSNWVFRRGQKPTFSRTIDIDEYEINFNSFGNNHIQKKNKSFVYNEEYGLLKE